MVKNKFIPKEIKELIGLIKEIGDDELFDKVRTIFNRNSNLLFRLHGMQLNSIVVNSLKTLINNYMETKEIKITPPEGYEIDKENSTFECIKFKPVVKRWRDKENNTFNGFYIGHECSIIPITKYRNVVKNHNIFATEKQAKSALAMAQISQIMANDERFGGIVTDEEWNNSHIGIYSIERFGNMYRGEMRNTLYTFLAFHTKEQRDLFLKENEDLVKDYLMID
jgi:hypothetical protein